MWCDADEQVLERQRSGQAGAPERVKVDTDFWTGQAQQYGQRVLLAFQSGDIPDIVLNGHEFIGRYATAGYIRPLDDLLAAHQAALADVYPVLWQAVRFHGQIWALPQDTEARMMYVRTDHLRKLGWSAEAIAGLPQRVEQGDLLGASGDVGNSSGPHLHFIVMKRDGKGPREAIRVTFADVPGDGIPLENAANSAPAPAPAVSN